MIGVNSGIKNSIWHSKIKIFLLYKMDLQKGYSTLESIVTSMEITTSELNLPQATTQNNPRAP